MNLFQRIESCTSRVEEEKYENKRNREKARKFNLRIGTQTIKRAISSIISFGYSFFICDEMKTMANLCSSFVTIVLK